MIEDCNRNNKSPCCRKVSTAKELDSAMTLGLSGTVQSVISTIKYSTDTTDLQPHVSMLKSKDSKTKSDEYSISNPDDRLSTLFKYQKEIKRRCSHNCPTKKNFTDDIINKYSNYETSNKISLATIMKLKATFPEAPCPYIIDADAYIIFQEFFIRLISDLQNGAELTDTCQGLTFGDIDSYENLDLNEDKEVLKVMYCEIIVRRNINDYNLAGCLKNEQRVQLKDILKAKCREIFASLSPVTIPDEWVARLKADETYLTLSNAMNNYPKGRVNLVFKDEQDCNLGCIINYDDHMQLVLSTNNGKLGHIYSQACQILNSTLLSKMEFMKHHKYGYITYSPQHIGTGFIIRIILRLTFICLMDDVEHIYLKDLGLSLKIHDISKGLIILSNSRTIAITELQIFQNILEGFRRLFDLDQELRYTSPNAIIDKTMPVESMETLVGNIYGCQSARTYTKKYLTDAIIHQYENVATTYNGLFNHCIRANAFYPKSLFPKACDADCYSTFSRFFNPIILESNHCRQFLHSPTSNYDIAKSNIRFKFHHDLIKGYRVRFSRNLEDYPFPMLLSSTEREEIENKLIGAFNEFPETICGSYYKLENIFEYEIYNFLEDLNLIPKPDNSIKRASWVYRDWPQNRGIFVSSKDKNQPANVLIILVNEADHFQVSCINYSGRRLDYCYDRAVIAMNFLDNYFKDGYSKKPNYGYLSSNPQNIGCSMRVGAKILLKYLGEDRSVLDEFCILNNMNYRGNFGSGTNSIDNIFDISLKLNLNYSEIQILMYFVQRIKDLILEERTYDHEIALPENKEDSIESNSDKEIESIVNQVELADLDTASMDEYPEYESDKEKNIQEHEIIPEKLPPKTGNSVKILDKEISIRS